MYLKRTSFRLHTAEAPDINNFEMLLNMQQNST